MNPIFTLLIKQLPRLLPVVKSLLERQRAVTARTEDGRLAAVEQSVEWLAERSDVVERKLKRLTLLVAAGLVVSLVALVIVLTR